MAALELYQVIASLPVVVEDGGVAISYSPGQTFMASPRLPSVIRLLEVRAIVLVPVGGNTQPVVALITDDELAERYIKANGTRAFTGTQSMGGHYLTNLLDPVNPQDAASKAYVDAAAGGPASQLATSGSPVTINTNAPSVGQVLIATSPTNATWQTLPDDDSNFIRKDGTVPLTANWNVGSFKLTSLLDPTAAQDAATKNYVDTNFIHRDGSVAFTGSQSLAGFDLTNIGSASVLTLTLRGSTSGTVSFAAPVIAGTQSYTLPTAIGAAGSVLTDAAGNGTLSWATAGGGSTLDGAYDFGGLGAGRIITVDAGAVRLNKTAADSTNGFETVTTSTTIAVGSNNQALPQATINVASTTGFPASGTITVNTTTGRQSVTYTGITGTSFTGCTGGTGTMVTGSRVIVGTGLAGLFDGGNLSCPGTGTTSEKYGAGVCFNGTANFNVGIGGTGVITNSTDCIVLGHNSTAGSNSSDDHAIVIGDNSLGYARRSVVIGRNNTGGASATSSSGMIAIGDGCYAGTPTQFDFDCIAIGDTAFAGGFLPTSNPGGTVTVTNGSPTVTGTTVGMFNGFFAGDSIIFSSQPSTTYTILTPGSSTITLTGNYTGTTSSGVQVITGIGNGDYIAIGLGAKALGGRGENTAIGTSARAGWGPNDANCIAIGLNSKAYGVVSGGLGSIAIGRTATSFGSDSSIAIGGSAIAGNSSSPTGVGTNFISIGGGSATGLQNCIILGTGTAGLGNSTTAGVGDQYCFLMGAGTAASRGTVFAGSNLTNVTNGSPTVTNASGLFTSQLFAGAEIQFTSQPGTYYTVQSIASDTSLTLTTNYTGTSSSTTNINQRVRNVIVLGQSSNGEIAGGLTGTGARYGNCLVAGSIAGPITDIYFGSGIQSEGSTAPSSAIIHGSSGSKTTNQNGADISLAGGLGYGAANVGGAIRMKVAHTGTARTLGDSWVFRNDGAYELTGLSADPAVSGGANAAIYYNTSTQNVRISKNGAAWADFGAGGGGSTLDGAYDFGGLGAGRTITVDAGAVVLNKTDSGQTTNGLEVSFLTTTVAAGSNNLTLPQATINVASTTGFDAAGKILVYTSGGPAFVTYTGITGTSFTGCTGGSGKLLTGITVAAGWGNTAVFTGNAPSAKGTGPQGTTQTEVWGNSSQCGGGFSVVLGDSAVINQTAHFTDGVLIGTNSSTLSAVTTSNFNFCSDFVGIGCGAYVGSFGSVVIGSTSSGPNETAELATLVGCFSSAAGQYTCVFGEGTNGGSECIAIGMGISGASATGSIHIGHSRLSGISAGGSANNAICIGSNTSSGAGAGGDSQYNVYIGQQIRSAAIDGASNHNIWIGHRVTQNSNNSLDEAANNVLIGHDLRFVLGVNSWIHQVQDSVAIGANQVYATNPNQCVVIGSTATSSASGAVSVGYGSSVTGANGVALGLSSTAGASEFSVLNGDFNFKVGTATGVQFGASNTTKMSWFGSAPTAQLTVTGSRGGNAALASLLTQLATYGLIVDGTTA